MNEPVKPLNDAKNAPTILSEIPRHPSGAQGYAPLDAPIRIPRLNSVLFLLTMLTTTMAGASMAGADFSLLHPLSSFAALASGLSFSIPVMLVLLAHEVGHYVAARRNGVDASLPYFIPVPYFSQYSFVGTFGAFIRTRSTPNTRRTMFDISAIGPWAGMLIALPATIIGLQHSTIGPLDTSAGGMDLGNSLLFLGLSRWILGVDPNSVNVTLHPIALAGWLGFFVTTWNLLPGGHLDGGHVTFALFGRRWYRRIVRYAVVACVAMVAIPFILGKDYSFAWLLWAAILIIVGLGHPTATDDETPLDFRRQVMAWLTVLLFVITFTPVPFSYTTPGAPQEKDKIYQVWQHEPALPAARMSRHGREI